MAPQSNILPLPNKNDSSNKIDPKLEEWIHGNRGILEIFLDAYCVLDTSGRVVDFNIAFTSLCGVTFRKAKKIGEFSSLLQVESGVGDPVAEILSKKKALRMDEISASPYSGQSRKIILGGVPILDGAQKLLGVLLTVRDVTAEEELQKKYLARKEESVTDGLTKLYNKTFVEEMLIRMVRSSLRNLQGFSVLMTDIDHFKRVNDDFGHQAGDYVLANVSKLLKSEVRGTDVVGRFGGEEFIVLLHSNNTSGATIFGERFRQRVESHRFEFDGKRIPITVSVGTATFREKWRKGVDELELAKGIIAQADHALYHSKHSGRNQVWQWENLPDEVKAAV